MRVILKSSLFAILMLRAHAGGFLRDHDFKEYSVEKPGAWEFRYGLKEGAKPGVQPLWHCVARGDTSSSGQGRRYLSIEKRGRCAGAVAVGQRVALPDPVPTLDFCARFQAFCAAHNRSGTLSLMIYTPEVWDSLSSVPEKARQTLVPGNIYREVIQPQGDDTLVWTSERLGSLGFRKVLSEHAGKEIVVAVVFSAWHANTEEWAKLDHIWLGAPRPHIETRLWPKHIYQGEPLRLSVTAANDQEAPLVDLMVREAGSADEWKRVSTQASGKDMFEGRISGELTKKSLEVYAAVRNSAKRNLQTAPVSMRLTKRPSHPSLFYNRKELERMKRKASEFPWAKRIFDNLIKRAESWLTKPFEPRVICGWWWHHYNCKECGSRLEMKGPREHLCRNCDKVLDTEILFHVYWSKAHSDYATAARVLALAYQMTDEEKYAKRAVEFLTWYADHYAEFPQSDKGGKVVSQTLDECVWLLTMMNAADLVYAAMSPEEARHIERNLIYAGALHTRKYRSGIHNIRCWHNSCWASAGYFLGDLEMIDFARNHKFGFVAQMEQGVLEDGMWYERSMGYHNYTVSAILYQLKAAMHAGDDLYQMSQARKLITFPVMIAFPDMTTPSLNDGGFHGNPINPRFLELAVAWYKDPVALSALRKRYAMGASRSSMEAWQFGEEIPDGRSFTPSPSAILGGAGLAVLRSDSGRGAVCAMLEYGEHGGGHGHPDKLQLILYGLGKQLCPDLGTVGYANPLHRGYYKTTPAHNTVTINGRDMSPTSGRLLGFEVNKSYSAAVAEAATAYKGYNLIRRVLLCENILVDEFIVRGKTEGVLDWFLRANGSLTVSPDVKPIDETPLSTPYQYFKELKAVETEKQCSAVWRFKEKKNSTLPQRLVVTMKAADGTQVMSALAPGGAGLARHWGTLRVRRETDATRFLAVYQLLNSGAEEKPVTFAPGKVKVGERVIELAPEPTALPRLK